MPHDPQKNINPNPDAPRRAPPPGAVTQAEVDAAPAREAPELDPNLDKISRSQRAALTLEQPTPEPLPIAPEVDAHALLRAIKAANAGAKDALRVVDDKDYMYFYGCRRGHIAIWFRGNPAGANCTPKDWFSTYKQLHEPWTGYVWCQECYDADPEGYPRGEEQSIQVHYTPQGNRRPTVFLPNPRWLFKIARDPQRAVSEGGAIRVSDGVSRKNPNGDRKTRAQEAIRG